MEHTKLVAQKRSLIGKKVKQLRKKGILPANVYGKKIQSNAVEVAYADFLSVYKEVGETGIIDLTIDGKAVPVLVKNPQVDFRSNQPLHVDFYQVNLKEKIKTSVPVKVIGTPKAVDEKLGLLLQSLNEIEIEALPEQLPEAIEADVSVLEEVGDMLEVADLKIPEGVTVLTDPEQVVAQVSELIVEEKVPEQVVVPEGEVTVAGETTKETTPETETPAAETETTK